MQAAGRMGWSQDEFWLSTPRFFQNAYFGWMQQKNEDYIEGLRRTRIAAFYSFLPHTKKGALKKPENLFRLPNENPLPQFTDEFKAEAARVLEIAKTVDFFAGETMPQA